MAGGRKEESGNCFEGGKRMVRHKALLLHWKWEACSLMPSPCAPPGEKQSGEQSWAKKC